MIAGEIAGEIAGGIAGEIAGEIACVSEGSAILGILMLWMYLAMSVYRLVGILCCFCMSVVLQR